MPYVGSFSGISFVYCPFDIIQKRLLNGKTAETTSISTFYSLSDNLMSFANNIAIEIDIHNCVKR